MSARTCQRPLWNTARAPRPPVFCGKPAVEGRSWCAECLPRMVVRPQLSPDSQNRLAEKVRP